MRLEIWEVIIDELRMRSRAAAGTACYAAVSLNCFLRGGKATGLTTGDVIVSSGVDDDTVVSLRLGILERNERTNTGHWQGVILDRLHVA